MKFEILMIDGNCDTIELDREETRLFRNQINNSYREAIYVPLSNPEGIYFKKNIIKIKVIECTQ